MGLLPLGTCAAPWCTRRSPGAADPQAHPAFAVGGLTWARLYAHPAACALRKRCRRRIISGRGARQRRAETDRISSADELTLWRLHFAMPDAAHELFEIRQDFKEHDQRKDCAHITTPKIRS